MPGIKLAPVAAVGVGVLFVYSGIRGYSILKAAQNVIQGQGPNTGQSASLLAIDIPGGTSGSNAAGNAAGSGSIAGIAQSYTGKLRYVYGGPPPAGTVDCSSFASKVLAEAGVKNPGGAPYNPRTHGPTTLSYISWAGARTIGHTASAAQAGDLVVWQTHMGIAIGGGRMVSARNAAKGVGIDNIAGDMPGEILFVRRLR